MSDLLISVKIPGQVWAWLTSEFGLEPNATLHDVVIRHKEVKTRAETAERERDAWKQEADDERKSMRSALRVMQERAETAEASIKEWTARRKPIPLDALLAIEEIAPLIAHDKLGDPEAWMKAWDQVSPWLAALNPDKEKTRMNNEHENEAAIHNQMMRLLESLVASKPNDRSDLDKIYAVAITDVRRLWSWWWLSYAGLPPYPVDSNDTLPSVDGR